MWSGCSVAECCITAAPVRHTLSTFRGRSRSIGPTTITGVGCKCFPCHCRLGDPQGVLGAESTRNRGVNAMLSWQVGRVKITRIVEMDLPVPAAVIRQATAAELRKLAWLYPHFVSEDDNTLNLSIHALLVEAPGLKLVVDTCIGNDRPREITGGQPLATPFLQHLGEVGWSRDGVDAVVCTHLHVDHVGWNTMLENGAWVPTFPRARHPLGRA